MSLSPELTDLAERLITNKRNDRNQRIESDLWRRRDDAAARGALPTGFYAQAQKDACIRELNERADEIWSAYKKVISEASVPWSATLRDSLVARISNELVEDAARIEEMARTVITPYGHGLDLFLRAACPTAVSRISAEIDVFGLRHRSLTTPLSDQLVAPRYAGPARHWARMNELRRAEVPDILGAAREAVHTVEGLAKMVTGLPDATLGDCIKNLRSRGIINPAIAKQLEGLWGFVNTAPGLRHGAHESAEISEIELLYTVDASEAAAQMLLRLDRGNA